MIFKFVCTSAVYVVLFHHWLVAKAVESCTWPISTHPTSTGGGEVGLTRGTFVRGHGAAVFFVGSLECGGFFVLFFLSSTTHGLLQV